MVKKYDNPWNLTPGQVEVMDAICTHGCQKLAAAALGLSVKTVQAHADKAGQRIGARTMLAKYLAWDRWRRLAAKATGENGNG